MQLGLLFGTRSSVFIASVVRCRSRLLIKLRSTTTGLELDLVALGYGVVLFLIGRPSLLLVEGGRVRSMAVFLRGGRDVGVAGVWHEAAIE